MVVSIKSEKAVDIASRREKKEKTSPRKDEDWGKWERGGYYSWCGQSSIRYLGKGILISAAPRQKEK